MAPLHQWPAFGKSAFYFGALALFGMVVRFFEYLSRAQPIGPLFTWADTRYYVAMWAIFTGAYYIGWAIWYRWLRDARPKEIIEIKEPNERDHDDA
ncbi:hypothetical protein [Terricaulis silvestris]|uniref:Uncharacterized protein n=1 Tax=Terricaulis silvestris TaxID=2686094 RepID=A0A6I6MU52_9CAUL|nr:hypothetical protein [Terricaulis silvestris]QGZ96908.1 hypothetical protein DSM104635_03773 [Terricaulis silvestris]